MITSFGDLFYKVMFFLQNGLLGWDWWKILLFTLVVTHITIVSVTIYLHRCQAHRALDCHFILSHFFRLWLWLTTGMLTKQWAAVHRKHHAKCETEDDPHSPQTRGIKKVLFEGVELYKIEASNSDTLKRYGYGTPDDWIEKNLYSRYTILGVSLMLVIDILLFGVLGVTVWSVQMSWIPFWAAGVVNGLGHFWGYRNYDCPDASTNLSPIGILIGGEEMHNNHHTFPTSAKFSTQWFEFDIGWFYIRCLSILRLVHIKRTVPMPKLGMMKPVCDTEMLEAILVNRYEIMDRYASIFRKAYQCELTKVKVHEVEKYNALKRGKDFVERHVLNLGEDEKDHLTNFFSYSSVLHTLYQFRLELFDLWSKSNISREQLLDKLQSWCRRAEQSDVQLLVEFSGRLRRYS